MTWDKPEEEEEEESLERYAYRDVIISCVEPCILEKIIFLHSAIFVELIRQSYLRPAHNSCFQRPIVNHIYPVFRYV